MNNEISIGAPDTPTSPCEILDIDVVSERIDWRVYSCNVRDRNRTQISKSTARLELDQDQKSTINLLSEFLRFLIDVSPQGEQQRKLVEGTLIRLVERLGEMLFSLLFRDGDLRSYLIRRMDVFAGPTPELLRIELEFSGTSESLATWPWEYLRSPEGGGKYLARTAKLVLNRTPQSRFASQFSMQKPRVLLVVSRPDGQGPVEGDQVQKKLESMHASKQIVLEGLIEPTHDSLLDSDYHPTSSWDAFRKAVGKDHPNIIHFIGHGRLSYDETHKHEMGELAFVGNDGKADWIDGGKFADNVVGSALRLVFLQACESALADPRANISGVAMRLATQNVPAIIAMQHKVRNVVANGFATGFYDKLASGVPIDVAVMEARDEVANMEGQSKSQQLAFATPVVYLSSYEGLIERAEGGGSSAGLGLPTELSQVVRAEPPPVALKPIVEKCPSCDSNFTEDERRTLFFCDCGLQLRCDGKKRDGSACAEPLRSLTTKRRYCNWCGSVISAREIRAEPDIGALSPASQSDPEKELRMRFPLPPSSAGR